MKYESSILAHVTDHHSSSFGTELKLTAIDGNIHAIRMRLTVQELAEWLPINTLVIMDITTDPKALVGLPKDTEYQIIDITPII